MLLYINEKNIKPNVENNIFDFQPYISKYKDEPLNNFKNEFNGSLQTQNLQVSNVYTPKTKENTSIVKSYLNTINIDKSKGKINNKPIADFDYTLKDGEIILRNLSSDPDNDDLIYNWSISDNVSFSSKNDTTSFFSLLVIETFSIPFNLVPYFPLPPTNISKKTDIKIITTINAKKHIKVSNLCLNIKSLIPFKNFIFRILLQFL